jgi:hypothetical protein
MYINSFDKELNIGRPFNSGKGYDISVKIFFGEVFFFQTKIS